MSPMGAGLMGGGAGLLGGMMLGGAMADDGGGCGGGCGGERCSCPRMQAACLLHRQYGLAGCTGSGSVPCGRGGCSAMLYTLCCAGLDYVAVDEHAVLRCMRLPDTHAVVRRCSACSVLVYVLAAAVYATGLLDGMHRAASFMRLLSAFHQVHGSREILLLLGKHAHLLFEQEQAFQQRGCLCAGGCGGGGD